MSNNYDGLTPPGGPAEPKIEPAKLEKIMEEMAAESDTSSDSQETADSGWYTPYQYETSESD